MSVIIRRIGKHTGIKSFARARRCSMDKASWTPDPDQAARFASRQAQEQIDLLRRVDQRPEGGLYRYETEVAA